MKSDLGTWIVVSPCARTATIQIARTFDNLDVAGFNFMRNYMYVLAIPIGRMSLDALNLSLFRLAHPDFRDIIYYYIIDDILDFPDRVSSENRLKPGQCLTNKHTPQS